MTTEVETRNRLTSKGSPEGNGDGAKEAGEVGPGNPYGLTDVQLAACDHKLAGKSITEIADLVGRRRETVSAWFNQNHKIRFHMDLLRNSAHATRMARFEADCCDEALDVVAEAVK